MGSPIVTTLLILLAWANGEAPASNHMGASQDSIDKLADHMVDSLTRKFLDRAVQELHVQQADLDDTVLGKPGHLAMPLQHSPLAFTSHPFRTAPLRAHVSSLQLRPVTNYMQPVKAQQFQRSAMTGKIIQPARIGQFMKPPQLQYLKPVRAEATASGTEKKSGILVRWNYSKKYGFIKDNDNDEEIFFHLRDWITKDPKFPQQGDGVTYLKKFNERFDRDQAAEVEQIPGVSYFEHTHKGIREEKKKQKAKQLEDEPAEGEPAEKDEKEK